ncbi:hypothetical protein H7U19_05635 [Hyunsoonleella sp. SJ7]|uniref:Tetratricopeptide repeat protein n=1 Tax=Hyunsoonleella aquatilis TaxID=2762758 RepID=A0A923HG92_9FLAO|nr:hypothetical protein [Hyunsoonleella aquatilis]MBC3757877.1 hypothetical protein [Hyunsoonleella aquatilis]
MNDLNTIVSSFSKEDQLRFLSFLEKKNKRRDAKNVELFKLLGHADLDSKDICFQLYGKQNSGAYHALRKRLFQSIIHFSANSSLEDENSIQMDVIKYILASRNYLQQKQFNVANKILRKAELIAIEHHLFPLLNEIYHTQIQYAHAYPSADLNDLIQKFNKNKEKHHLEDQLNIVYSRIKQKLSKDDTSDFQSILDDTLKEFNMDIISKLSFKSLYQLISIVTVSAFATNDYLKIEAFLIKTYNTILSYKDKERQPFYHIQILYHIANTLFRNKKFEASETFLEKMHQLMLLHKNKYFNTFKLKYHLLLSLNYNYTNRQSMAIQSLEPFVNLKHPDIESILDIHLSLIMFYFQKGELKKAHQLFSKFYHSDKWYTQKAGIEWVIKKNLAEILLHVELGNIDLVESKLLSFKRHYLGFLKSIGQSRVVTYLNLVEQHYKNPEKVTSEQFKDKVETSFEWIEPEQEDIFVMSFYAWLKSKMDKEPLYNTTMELVKRAQFQK